MGNQVHLSRGHLYLGPRGKQKADKLWKLLPRRRAKRGFRPARKARGTIKDRRSIHEPPQNGSICARVDRTRAGGSSTACYALLGKTHAATM